MQSQGVGTKRVLRYLHWLHQIVPYQRLSKIIRSASHFLYTTYYRDAEPQCVSRKNSEFEAADLSSEAVPEKKTKTAMQAVSTIVCTPNFQ